MSIIATAPPSLTDNRSVQQLPPFFFILLEPRAPASKQSQEKDVNRIKDMSKAGPSTAAAASAKDAKRRRVEPAAAAAAVPAKTRVAAAAVPPATAPAPAAAAAPAAASRRPVAAAAVTSSGLQGAFLLVGTYHSVVSGVVLKKDGFHTKFATKPHIGCVNSVAVCDKFLASAGSDEKVFLFTAKDGFSALADLGSVAAAHEVTCCVFADSKHLLCGCNDGTVSVFRTRDWECVVNAPVHDKAVLALALHPTGTVAVTCGADRHVSVLDMSRVRIVTRIRLPPRVHASAVSFDPTGRTFAILTPYALHRYDTASLRREATLTIEAQPPNEFRAFAFVSADSVVVGVEDGSVYAARWPQADAAAAMASVAAGKTGANAGGASAKKAAKDAGKKRGRDGGDAGSEEGDEEAAPAALAAPTVQDDADSTAPTAEFAFVAAKLPSRVRCLSFLRGSLFGADSLGSLVHWRVPKVPAEQALEERNRMALGGRVTSLAVVPR